MAKPKQGAVHVIWGQTESGPIKTGQNRMTSGLSAEREFKKCSIASTLTQERDGDCLDARSLPLGLLATFTAQRDRSN